MVFRGGSRKSEATFVKQNLKLVRECGVIFSGPPAELDEFVDLFSEIQVLGPQFEKSRFLFGLFRGPLQKSETTCVNQLLILFHRCGLRFPGRASEHPSKIPLLHPPF